MSNLDLDYIKRKLILLVTGDIERVGEYPEAVGTYNDIYIGIHANHIRWNRCVLTVIFIRHVGKSNKSQRWSGSCYDWVILTCCLFAQVALRLPRALPNNPRSQKVSCFEMFDLYTENYIHGRISKTKWIYGDAWIIPILSGYTVSLTLVLVPIWYCEALHIYGLSLKFLNRSAIGWTMVTQFLMLKVILMPTGYVFSTRLQLVSVYDPINFSSKTD